MSLRATAETSSGRSLAFSNAFQGGDLLASVLWGRRPVVSSQPDDQIADLGGLGEEWVVAGVEFHDAACSTGELALQVGRGALVVRADEVRRGHVFPGR